MSVRKLDSGWIAARATSVPQTGEELTSSQFPTLETKEWMEAVVPGTVLTTLLKNKLIPDPFYGMENENVVDIGDAGREHYTFWFCNSFSSPKSEYALAWLRFQGINYSADVYVNGHKLSLPVGMFLRHNLDITAWVKSDEVNYLAVLVHPPEHPGKIPKEGGQGGDHDIAKDVAAQYVEGWDWICPIRDRNTGIWDDVIISFTGAVTLKDPHLVTTFYDQYTRSYLHTSAELNNSTPKDAVCTVKMQVTLDLEDGLCSVEQFHVMKVLVKAGSSTLYTFPQLFFYKPQLWWPNGMGQQPLYNVDIVVLIGDKESDSWSHQIGFRQIESDVDSSTGGRAFKVNGKPLFIRGGNWIVSDGLLRLSEKRYKTDVGFHADMNMNMMRVWGGALAERPAFYRACDERGVLVWQEFWITGDCNGRGIPPSEQSWPLDHELFLTCARDTVKVLRNHASLSLWVGGNEQVPADDINKALEAELKLNSNYKVDFSKLSDGPDVGDMDVSLYLDGTRLYIPGSLWGGFAEGSGAFSDGPYGIQNPEDFFAEDYYPYAFNPEIGSVGVPLAATIRATMPPEAWEPPKLVEVEGGYLLDVPNPTWEYHKYIPYSDPGNVHNQISIYGRPKNLDDFCEKAQLVNYVQYKALIESWNSRMWEKYTGVLIWKTQNPWPGLRGGLYDFLLDQTGGFFGIQSAAEPIHVQLNLATYVVEIVNTSGELLEDVVVEASVWDLDGGCPYQNTVKQLSASPYKTTKMFEIPYYKLVSAKPVYFLLLKLFRDSDVHLSRNFYWLHKPGSDYSTLEGDFQTKKALVHVVATATQEEGGMVQITAQVKNEATDNLMLSRRSSRSAQLADESGASRVAFWLHFSVHASGETTDELQDQRILPVTYTCNYFSLVPGESTTMQISFDYDKSVSPKLLLQGWNIDDLEVPFLFEDSMDEPSSAHFPRFW